MQSRPSSMATTRGSQTAPNSSKLLANHFENSPGSTRLQAPSGIPAPLVRAPDPPPRRLAVERGRRGRPRHAADGTARQL